MRSTIGAPSRSRTLATYSSRISPRPSVTIMTWRLRPFTFLPASYPVEPRLSVVSRSDCRERRRRRRPCDRCAHDRPRRERDRLEQAAVAPRSKPL